jgi:enoyl-CoA hydratase
MVTPPLPPSLLLSADGPVRLLAFNRPEQLNALDDDARRGLVDVFRWFEDEEDVSVLVVTGVGSAFSAGGDLDSLQRLHEDVGYRDRSMAEAEELVQVMLGLSKPVIAAVNGPAVGLGCSVSQLCDIVLTTEAAWFADPHVSVGLVAGDGGALLWPLAVGPLRAKEHLFTGDRLSATDAVRYGLANRLVPAEVLVDEALALGQRLASQPQQALRDTKRAVNLQLRAVADIVMPFATAAEGASAAADDLPRQVAALRDGQAVSRPERND